MTTFHIRIATHADTEVVAELFDAYRQFYEQASDLALARKFISDRIQNNESVILVAVTESRQALGFCQLYPTFCSVEAVSTYSLYDLFVIPEARRAGTGRALLRSAEDLAATNGMARLDLTTAKTNRSAQSVYESLGWVRDEDYFTYSRHIQR